MPSRKRLGPKRAGRATQTHSYGAGDAGGAVFYGTNKDKLLAFVREAQGEPGPPLPYNATARARWKMEYLGHGAGERNAVRKFRALPAGEKTEANAAARRHFTAQRAGNGRIAMTATYQRPDDKRRALKIGPAAFGEGRLTFRAKDFLERVRANSGDLWGTLADLYNDEKDAKIDSPEQWWTASGAPSDVRIISGEAANLDEGAA